MNTSLLELRSRLETLTTGLRDVTLRRMFGCDAFLARGAIFAMVWREGRIGLRLPDDQLAELRALPGAAPWRHRDMVVRQWVLVPEALHGEPERLRPWVKKAHAAALVRGAASVNVKPRAGRKGGRSPGKRAKKAAKPRSPARGPRR